MVSLEWSMGLKCTWVVLLSVGVLKVGGCFLTNAESLHGPLKTEIMCWGTGMGDLSRTKGEFCHPPPKQQKEKTQTSWTLGAFLGVPQYCFELGKSGES